MPPGSRSPTRSPLLPDRHLIRCPYEPCAIAPVAWPSKSLDNLQICAERRRLISFSFASYGLRNNENHDEHTRHDMAHAG